MYVYAKLYVLISRDTIVEPQHPTSPNIQTLLKLLLRLRRHLAAPPYTAAYNFGTGSGEHTEWPPPPRPPPPADEEEGTPVPEAQQTTPEVETSKRGRSAR